MISIREVAKKAGVSPATVSRVINGTANVDPDKRDKVLEVIASTGYQPNELARALFKKTSKIIGIIVPNIENPFWAELSKAVEEEAYRHGYRMLLCNSNDDTDKEQMNIQMLNQMKAEGIIITGHSSEQKDMLEKSSVPVVTVDRQLQVTGAIANIESDHYAGGRIAAQHLIDCGCKNIVCMKGPQNTSSGVQRYKAYRDICEEYHLPEQFIDCDYSYDEGIIKTEELLRQYPQVDGILAGNDMVAISAYKVLTSGGKRVPEDCQIIGFDNIHLSSIVTPEITTVEQQISQMGKMAVQIIISNNEGRTFSKENKLPVTLIPRQTTMKKVDG